MSMGMLKRKRASPPLPDAPASKKVSREDPASLVGANGEPLEVLPDREEVVLQEPKVVKQQVGQPHSSVLAVVQAERAVESAEERDVDLKVPLPILENISQGQLVPLDLPGGARSGQSGIDGTLSSQTPKFPPAANSQKSADAPVHLIPCHAGWFSWTSINVLERRGLPEFFDGKSNLKTPQIYLEHRNAIICKYRENFSKILTIDDMKDILVGDGNAAARIIEFLDHWGIINYQASLDSKAHLPDWLGQAALIDEAPDRKLQSAALPDPPLQSLYAFESTRAPVPKPSPEPSKESNKESSASLLDVKVAEALSFSNGPAVEYHCNGCAADCSKHRYHCQKQADFDLCPDCYNDGKFGEGMTSTDFIRMDAQTDTGDSDGGGWTDQETLLLLEALELFGDNWTEIAEHVATKSKSQCILHFIRLPIEDPFLEEMETPGAVTSAPPAPKSGSDVRPVRAMVDKDAAADTANTPAGAVVVKKDAEGSALTENGHRSKDPGGSKSGKQNMGECKSEEVIAFADAGNPVMTQVAFLAAMVGPRVAASAAQSALMALSGVKPAANLANRNCLVLDLPEFDWSKPGPDPSKMLDSKPSKASEEGKVEDKETALQTDANKEAKLEDMDASLSEIKQDSKGSVIVAEEGHDPSVKEPEESPVKKESLELEGEAGEEGEEEADVDDSVSPGVEDLEDVTSAVNVRRAAAAALAAAAVKSKLLADQEEREIQHLVGIVIENQLRKLEVKLKHFSELEVMLAKECDQVDRTRQKYIAERQRLISSRLTPSTQSQTAAISSLFPVSKPLPAGLSAAAAAAVSSSNLPSVQTGLAQPASTMPGSSGIPRPQQMFPFTNKPGVLPSNMAPYGNRPAMGVGPVPVPGPGPGPGPGPPNLQQHPGALSGYYNGPAAHVQQQQQQQEGSGWFHVPQNDGGDRHR